MGYPDPAMGEVDERPRNLPVQERAVLTRDRILQAATEVIKQEGVSSLTLDKVAAQAGVSKGGLLYHFGSKDALVIGLLNQVMGVLDNELNVLAEGIDARRGAFALAYLDYVREPTQAATDTAVSILAAAAVDDDLLDSTRATFELWQDRLRHDDGLDDVVALLARIVGDGLWLIDLFGLAPPTAEERRKVIDLVSNLIGDHGAARDLIGSAE